MSYSNVNESPGMRWLKDTTKQNKDDKKDGEKKDKR
jgi:hypothetical protein